MAGSRKGASWEADAVVQTRNGGGLDSVVVGGEKWTEKNDSQDVGRKGERVNNDSTFWI